MDEARFEYCKYLYDREFELKDRLEKKAGTTFAFPSTLIGVLFLNPDSTEELAQFMGKSHTNGLFVISLVILVLFVVSISFSLLFSVISITLQKYQKEYPKKLYEYLFTPQKRYLKTKETFYEEVGGRLSIATEHNGHMNEKKAGYLSYAIWTLVFGIIFLLLFLILYLSQKLI